MKTKKKIIAILLSLAMIFVLPVTASALYTYDPYVFAYIAQDGSEQCLLYIKNYGLDICLSNALAYATEQSCDITDVITNISIDGKYIICCSGEDLSALPNVAVAEIGSDGTYNWDESTNIPLGAYYYITENDVGIVICFDNSSEYVSKLANTNNVLFQCEAILSDGNKIAVGDSTSWNTVNTFDNYLNDYKTSNDTVVDTKAPTEETKEDNSDANIDLDSITDEPVTNEPIVDEPVADEPVVDEPVADEPVVDTNVDAGSADKTSPDTGMGGIAALAAISITGLGAAVLSKKRK